MATPIKGFAEYLVTNNFLSAQTIQTALEKAKTQQLSFIKYLVNNKLLSYKIIAETTAQYFGLALTDLQNIPKTFTDLLDKNFIEQHQVIPINKQNNQLYVALIDPTNSQILNEIKFRTNLHVKPVIAEYEKLNKTIAALFLQSYSEDAEIIGLVDQILNDAIKDKASDIHFETFADNYRVRFRIDSILHETIKLDINIANRINARLKIMAKLDISERRLPQDGRFSFHTDQHHYDCRISSCPTIHGEKIVIRLLYINHSLLSLEELGLNVQQINAFRQTLKRPQGMILVTGPTGSGKTVSLYAALNEINTPEKNISTAEDPIEIYLPGINQVNINTKIGLDFATILRTFLRQDPDIIMLGEIRDIETADMAIKAAQTGHLVLSTLHTNSAAESITRLLNMGIKAFNIDNALSLVIAQRLVRKLCPHCKQKQIMKTPLLKNFNELNAYEAKGCEYCHQGYQGRIGVFEFLLISPTICHLIIQQKSSIDIQQQALKEGMITLQQNALTKVAEGITSLAEINRVIN